MKYQDARADIKSGDMLAFRHTGWNSWHDIKVELVRMFTKSEYSHLATAWVVGGRVFVIEAVVPLVRIYPLSKLGDFYWIPMQAPWEPETEEFALSVVGQPYSQLEAMEAFFGSTPQDSLWYCSELARSIAEKDDIKVPGGYTPAEVVLSLQKDLGKQVIYVNNP